MLVAESSRYLLPKMTLRLSLKISNTFLGPAGVLLQGQGRVTNSKQTIKNAERLQIKMHFDYFMSLLCITQATPVDMLLLTQTQLPCSKSEACPPSGRPQVSHEREMS